MPTLLEHFRIMHQRVGPDGKKEFCDSKSADTYEKLEEKISELREQMEVNDEEVDENNLFLIALEEIGCMKKGRAYGIENQVSTISNGSCSSTAATPGDGFPMAEATKELVERLVEETMTQRLADVEKNMYLKFASVLQKFKGQVDGVAPIDASGSDEEAENEDLDNDDAELDNVEADDAKPDDHM